MFFWHIQPSHLLEVSPQTPLLTGLFPLLRWTLVGPRTGCFQYRCFVRRPCGGQRAGTDAGSGSRVPRVPGPLRLAAWRPCDFYPRGLHFLTWKWEQDADGLTGFPGTPGRGACARAGAVRPRGSVLFFNLSMPACAPIISSSPAGFPPTLSLVPLTVVYTSPET